MPLAVPLVALGALVKSSHRWSWAVVFGPRPAEERPGSCGRTGQYLGPVAFDSSGTAARARELPAQVLNFVGASFRAKPAPRPAAAVLVFSPGIARKGCEPLPHGAPHLLGLRCLRKAFATSALWLWVSERTPPPPFRAPLPPPGLEWSSHAHTYLPSLKPSA